jgi:hypothetical protein
MEVASHSKIKWNSSANLPVSQRVQVLSANGIPHQLPTSVHKLSRTILKGHSQIQVKFYMPLLTLTVLYHGISNDHTKYEFWMVSYTQDIALRNLQYVNKTWALFTLTQFKNRKHTGKYDV